MLGYLNKLQNPLLESQDSDFIPCLGEDSDVKLTDKERRKRYKYFDNEVL